MMGERRRVGSFEKGDALKSLIEIGKSINAAIEYASDPVMEGVFEEDVLLYFRKSLHDIGVGVDVQINRIMNHSHGLNFREKVLEPGDT